MESHPPILVCDAGTDLFALLRRLPDGGLIAFPSATAEAEEKLRQADQYPFRKLVRIGSWLIGDPVPLD